MADLKIKAYNSFAKINLFLHVLNKRDDGYHNLQTWFTFVDLKDQLKFNFNTSTNINIKSDITIASKEDNLIFKAIKIFQQAYGVQCVGVDIEVIKNIPMGAGLGGGSSNAATTLIAMRDHYTPDVKNSEMISLATKLGADVPIFLYGRSAWAEGVGEVLYPKDFNTKFVLLVKPNIHINTKESFGSKELIKSSKLLSKELEFDSNIMQNVFEKVFFANYPDFESHLRSLDANFRMTGTGSCFYLFSDDRARLQQLATKINKPLDKWLVKTLNYVY
ncbi:4-(cytidine 5'-diphospho)-2-C-methyl-D-erythritol kinase [Allofrancisella guangzhouensis]|uniref:4-diphosphocytidyl-2-C-methyl-D-erythritol kinase n=1 Tax=Allofrancisella guangzhouensis TaxID=594679 RepID=A0A0A8E480_9GAMM|nr:4-(cytidine 5'-diphospho)-2-C-methyl-D-erythritol kinase [Allofrancisella guangzhouensis]AJC48412.1 4-diphosphocytidyl-2C-methyl-D-erythritol kinase [Allofrancisella guangzhouensis]MBK2027303.1 4-(cytidine 5'-diphospho)-2-C-methyl-D-erythritol kinase [Allofrancisella guangzhouensis]MBK2043541.1 4-(cytidine 5'-diphospho)-2-C-methyl-D-erythritol kinase [Allofrancisella guangzhouensis]MBK2045473.1 4-(cytidine 5'-diphospho)-2-C-methyl-D-erythritol kinase [Allofrancisella guangzhouensis]